MGGPLRLTVSSLALAALTYGVALAAPVPCDTAKAVEVLAPADASASTVLIDCHLTLEPKHVVTKRLVLEGARATGVVVDCNGAMLNGGAGTVNHNKDMVEVRSLEIAEDRWERPENVTIKRCQIVGSVRIWGMGRNGEAEAVKKSSKRERSTSSDHRRRARDAAPKNVVLDGVVITGLGRNPLYFAPGVTHSKLLNSEMKGKSSKVAIYLDAESAYNTIKNNDIHVATDDDDWGELPGVTNRGWPLIALDGSTGNKIIDNRFSSLNNGGIYLYRNCGEGGTIRHTTPSRNVIVNNVFYYKKYKGSKPAVFLSSRDYGTKERLGHCNDDDGRPYGSSASEKDFARHNVVMQNQFYARSVYRGGGGPMPPRLVAATLADYVMTKNASVNTPNYVAHNEIITQETKRLAGCYVRNGYKDFILHGESIDVFKDPSGAPVCGTRRLRCDDGELGSSTGSGCTVQKQAFECRVEGNNDGCERIARCPGGRRVVGASAACNLEFGEVDDGVLAGVPANRIKVVRASDDVSKGRCHVGESAAREGEAAITGSYGGGQLPFGCKERDENGGDCQIRGMLFCR